MRGTPPHSRAGPSRAYVAYSLSWLAVGLVLLALSVPHLARVDRQAYLTFAALALVGNLITVQLPSGIRAGMQAPFTLAAAWLLGWPTAPAVNFASAALLVALFRLSPWRAAVFAGNASLGVCGAAAVFWSLSGGPLRPDAGPHQVAALVAGGALHCLVNSVAASLGRALETQDASHFTVRQAALLAGLTVSVYVPVSYLLAVAFRTSVPVFATTVGVWLMVGLSLQAYWSSRRLQAQLEQATREVERLSTTDPLTDLLNRRSFGEVGQRELARHRRYGDPVSLVLLDLRGFKQVNDTFGHQAGDAVLQWVAHVLRRRIRRTDFAFRLGGDEFAVLLPGTGLSGALMFAESLHGALRSPQHLRGADVTVGVASCPEHGATLDELVRAADRALYRAREEGRTVRAADP